MGIPWRVTAPGPEGHWVDVGDVEAPDSRTAQQRVRQRWPELVAFVVQSRASVAVQEEEQRAREREDSSLLTLPEAARLLGMDVHRLYRAATSGDLFVRRRVGSTALHVDRRTLERWAASLRNGDPDAGDDDGVCPE